MRTAFTRTHRLAGFAALCLLVTHSAPAQSPAPPPPRPAQEIASKVDEYMNAAVRVKRFSGSVLVALEGRPVISKGYGMANYELGVPNTPQTVFRLGSITKPFTAVAVMMLQERGKLSLGDSVCKHLSDCPEAWRPVTIRHLLTHTSGLPDYESSPGFINILSLPISHASMIERFKALPPQSAPGEKARYNNLGYYLSGVVIERASGKTYEDFLRENIFNPLGMAGTGYDVSSRVVRNRAAGYAVRDGVFVNAPYIDMSIPYAGGALQSTVEDLLRWEQALYTEKLLSRRSLDEMFTPFKDEFGYGWTVRKQFGRPTTEKDGGIAGFSTFLARFPADRTTVIVLGNNSGVNARGIGMDLSAIVYGEPYKLQQERKALALDAKTLEKYVGQYQPARGSVITVTYENGKLMRQVGQQPKVEFFAESETKFFIKDVDVLTTFVTDGQGRVTGMVLHRGGRDFPAPKIK